MKEYVYLKMWLIEHVCILVRKQITNQCVVLSRIIEYSV